MNIKKMEVANFTCKSVIGEAELLDVFEDYVFPAMKYQEVKGSRNSETLSYKFIDLEFHKIDKELILSGRLVKNLNIKRQQILEGEELVQSYDTMESSPSSFFVLILSNHKLLWVREVPRAPLLKDFKYAVSKMLTHQRSDLIYEYILKEKQNLFSSNLKKEDIERKAYGEYPDLDINVTPLGNKIAIKEKLAKFKNIYYVKLKALKRNNELASDFSALSRTMSQAQELSGAKDATAELKIDKKNSLNKEYITNLVQASADGNYEYLVKGKDDAGIDLKESNETVSLVTEINYKEDKSENINTMYRKFMTLTPMYHSLPRQSTDLYNKLKEIEKNINK